MRKIQSGFCSRAPARCNWFCGLDGSDRAIRAYFEPLQCWLRSCLGNDHPGGGPVSIYDLSYPAKTKLGTSKSIDAKGNFAASVKPTFGGRTPNRRCGFKRCE